MSIVGSNALCSLHINPFSLIVLQISQNIEMKSLGGMFPLAKEAARFSTEFAISLSFFRSIAFPRFFLK